MFRRMNHLFRRQLTTLELHLLFRHISCLTPRDFRVLVPFLRFAVAAQACQLDMSELITIPSLSS